MRDEYIRQSKEVSVRGALRQTQHRQPCKIWALGQKVKYWSTKLGDIGWKGPATVIGDNVNTKVLTLDHAGRTVRRTYGEVIHLATD